MTLVGHRQIVISSSLVPSHLTCRLGLCLAVLCHLELLAVYLFAFLGFQKSVSFPDAFAQLSASLDGESVCFPLFQHFHKLWGLLCVLLLSGILSITSGAVDVLVHPRVRRCQSCQANTTSICAGAPPSRASRVCVSSSCFVSCRVLQAIKNCSSMDSTCLSRSCACAEAAALATNHILHFIFSSSQMHSFQLPVQ